ncbi:oxygen sensor histidine kinase NreB [Macrococcus hajekii]|uniref:sensor histidine kinase n=1 Tax=Macrococcus hajekii TaxID=198482 RepID=UPI00199B4768|nr:sensor histidine kinase [Macrococcus hajekii]GGB08415.1 oxygen sensor histidine kinase NreB [Macrococcus hajekii]
MVNLDKWMLQYFEESSDMIIFLDKHNHILYMNHAAQKVLTTGENVSQITDALCTYCQGFTNESEKMTCINCFTHNQKLQNETFQVFMKDKEGNTVPYSASYVEMAGEEKIKVLSMQDVSPQLRTQAIHHQKTLTQKIISTQESERKRISRELHDSVVQELLNVVVDFRLLKYKTDEELSKHTQLMEGTMTRLIDDIRNLSLELRPSSLDDFGLEAAFRSHFRQLEKNYGLEVEMLSNLEGRRFDSEIETVVYRVTQEAILNAMKYAETDEVYINIAYDKDELTVEIADQGKGFDISSPPKGTGLGLFGMQERAEIVGGTVNINSEAGRGTQVTLTIPIGG